MLAPTKRKGCQFERILQKRHQIRSCCNQILKVPSSRLSPKIRHERLFSPLGFGTGRKESTIFAGWSNCYLGSNDPYGETLHSMLSLSRANYVFIDRFVSVVGSFVALQYLVLLRPKAIHFFDMNPCQVKWAQMLCELIAISKSPQEFISRIFGRGVTAFENQLAPEGAHRVRLTYLNQHQFLQLPVSSRWRQSTIALLSADARDTYREVLMPMQTQERRGWFTSALLPCEDRRRFRTLSRTGLGPQGRLPSDGFASFLYGEGWLTCLSTFHEVKSTLATVPITWTVGVDFPISYPEDVFARDRDKSNDSTLLFTMDMWSSHFAKPWSRHHTLEWRSTFGRLVVIQSITAKRHELVQELVGESSSDSGPLRWRSLSEWDSSVLLPPHVCQMGEAVYSGCRHLEQENARTYLEHPLMRSKSGIEKRLLKNLVSPRFLPSIDVPYCKEGDA